MAIKPQTVVTPPSTPIARDVPDPPSGSGIDNDWWQSIKGLLRDQQTQLQSHESTITTLQAAVKALQA